MENRKIIGILAIALGSFLWHKESQKIKPSKQENEDTRGGSAITVGNVAAIASIGVGIWLLIKKD
jgi:hypothetical protein